MQVVIGGDVTGLQPEQLWLLGLSAVVERMETGVSTMAVPALP